jgi:hypothetical protein
LGVQGALALGKIAVSSVISGMISLIGFASRTAASFVTMGVTAASSFVSAAVSAVGGFVAMEAAALKAKFAFLSTWAAAVGPIAGAVAGIALVAGGLGALGFALNPGKFTAFGKVVTDTFNGLKSVVSDCWAAIQEGDFSAVATRLKSAFSNSVEYIKNIDWSALGSDIITMIGDGIKSVISTAANIADSIKITLESWINSNGPEKLGYGVADAIISGISSLFSNTGSLWDTISSILGTANDWLQVGWDIAIGIGSGIYERIAPYIDDVYNSIIDFAGNSASTLIEWKVTISNTLIETFKSIQLSIAETATKFKSWVTDVKISTFTLPGWVSDLENALQNISKYLDRISNYDLNDLIAEMGQWVDFGTNEKMTIQSVKSSNSGTSYTPEGTYYSKSMGSWLSGEYLNTQGNYGVTDWVKVASAGSTKIVSESIETRNANAVNTNNIVSAIKSTNDIGQQVKISWINPVTGETEQLYQEQIDVKEFFLGLRKERTASEFATNENINKEKKATDENISTVKSMMDGVVKNVKSTTDETTKNIKSMMDNVISAAEYANNMQKANAIEVSRILVNGSQTAANAIQLGGQVSANFTSQAGQAVQIGLTKSGQEIAVIGRVAQENFTKAGGDLYNKVQVTGSNFMVSGKNAGSSIEKSASASSTTFSNGVSGATNTFSSGVSTATNGLVSGLGTAAGSLAAAIGGISSSIFSSLFKSGGSSGVSYSGGTSSSIGSATQTFNDCMFEGFTDTCTNMNINALKYTNPNGVVSYINPMTYIDTGGIASYIGKTSSNATSSSSSGGVLTNAGYKLPAVFSAKGALFNKPAVTAIGESGREMVLPSDLTETVIALTRMGFAKTKSNNMQMSSGDMLKYINGNVVNAKSSNEKLMLNLTIEMNGRQMANELIPIMFNEANRIGLKLKH